VTRTPAAVERHKLRIRRVNRGKTYKCACHPHDSAKKQIVVPSAAAAIIAITLDFYEQSSLSRN